MELYDKIRIIRKARGKTQVDLANELGLSRQAVSDWERGKFVPKLENIRDLVRIFDVSYDALLDESINLDDKATLNVVLNHVSNETKKKINDSYRYHIYKYDIKTIDYIKTYVYFALMLISIIVLIIGLVTISSNVGATLLWVGGIIALIVVSLVSLPFHWIKRIKCGSDYRSFGTLSQTHFVMIDWSNINYDKTIYIPVTEIISMKLDESASKKHGRVIVNIKGRAKPILTEDIVNPMGLIREFDNLNINRDKQ